MKEYNSNCTNLSSDIYLSIICPMYNEGMSIQSNLINLIQVLEKNYKDDFEIILVNDGSTDNALEEATKIVERDSRLRLISYKKNRGRGYALRQGFGITRGDIIVTTESDLSWGESIIKDMVDKLESEELDMVVASPHTKGGKLVNVPRFRVLLTRFGNFLLRFLMPGNLTMYTGMTRAYRRPVLDALDLEEDSKEIHLEIIAKASALGFSIGEVPATLAWEKGKRRKRGKLSFNAKKLILSHLLFGFAEFPLFLFGTIAGILFVIAFVAGIYMLVLSLSGISQAGRPLMLITILFILAAIQILLFSFMAHQIRDVKRHLVRLQGDIRKKTKQDGK